MIHAGWKNHSLNVMVQVYIVMLIGRSQFLIFKKYVKICESFLWPFFPAQQHVVAVQCPGCQSCVGLLQQKWPEMCATTVQASHAAFSQLSSRLGRIRMDTS